MLLSTLSGIRHLIWGRKWLVDFNAGKTQLVSFDQSNNSGAVDVKMNGPVLEEKSSFKRSSCYLPLLDKLQKRVCMTVGPSFAASLESLANYRNVASVSLF